MQYDLIAECENQKPAGTEQDLFLACACDVADPFPSPPSTGAQGATMVVTSDIILKPLKAFHKLRVIIDSGALGDEKKASGYTQSFTAKTLTDKNYDEFFNNNPIGGCFIGIVPQKSGENRLLGHPTKGPLRLTAAKRTVTNEVSEWEFTLEATPGNVAYIYEGDIDLDPLT